MTVPARYFVENTKEWKDTLPDPQVRHFDTNDNTWYKHINGVKHKAVKINAGLDYFSNNYTWVAV